MPRYFWTTVQQAKRHEELVREEGVPITRRGRQTYVPRPNRNGPTADRIAQQVDEEVALNVAAAVGHYDGEG